MIWILFLLALPNANAYGAGQVFYVTPNGSGDCSSWANACDLQTALNNATAGDEIWVKAGVYYPTARLDATDPRSATFSLKSGVALYGGFAGNETSLDQRDPRTHITVLSGDIDKNDTTDANGVVTDPANINGSNAYHVVYADGVDNTTVLDGFVITAGDAKGSSSGEYGGGIYILNSGAPLLRRLRVIGNKAGWGGGIGNFGGAPRLTNVSIEHNAVTNQGGGMYTEHNDAVRLDNVLFLKNTAKEGAGVFAYYAAVTIVNATFYGNQGL